MKEPPVSSPRRLPLKPPKTAADYLAIAIGPVLLTSLVGSLGFFLLQIGYAGDYLSRLRWTLFWFVLAAVFISRVSIERGASVAQIYGLGLAMATGLIVHQFIDQAILVSLALLFLWWCAGKLTWDC